MAYPPDSMPDVEPRDELYALTRQIRARNLRPHCPDCANPADRARPIDPKLVLPQ